MPLALTRSHLIGRQPLWLLEVTWAGRVFRFSSRPVSLSSASGDVPFDGGLDEADFSEALDRLSNSPSGQSSSLEVIFPVDVAELRRKGHDLAAATGELSMVLELDGQVEQTWEDRFRLLAGRVTQPQYGAPGRPAGWAAFTIEEAPHNDAAIIIDASARISPQTWPVSDYPESVEGKVYPLIIGTPGKYTDSDGDEKRTAGSPAYVLDYTTTADGDAADKLLIAGHPVVATSVTVIDQAGASELFTVTSEPDLNARQVSTVDVSGAADLDRYSTEFWISWSGEGGLVSPFGRSGTMRGAGDVCRHMLWLSSLAVDHGRWAAVAEALNAYKIDAYVNAPDAGPWAWLSDNVLPLIPVSVLSGPDGLFPVLYAIEARGGDAHPIEAGPDFSRAGAVTSEVHPADIRNHLTLEYAKDGSGGEFLRYAELSASPDLAIPGSGSNLYVKVSAGRYGEASAVVETDVVYDPATAALILEWWSRAKTFSPESVPYLAAIHWGWLAVGDTVKLTDAELHLTDQVATVLEKSWAATGWAFKLLIDDDLPRDNRAT